MLRVDKGTHKILTIQYKGDHHRFAVPVSYTIGLAASRAVDSMIQPAPDRRNERKPSQRFTLSIDGFVKHPDEGVMDISENSYCMVKELESE